MRLPEYENFLTPVERPVERQTVLTMTNEIIELTDEALNLAKLIDNTVFPERTTGVPNITEMTQGDGLFARLGSVKEGLKFLTVTLRETYRDLE